MDSQVYEAAELGRTSCLTCLTNPDLHQVTPQKNTILHIAVNFKQLEFSKQVLGFCPSLLLRANSKGESPLHVTAKIGCLEIVEHLVNSAKTLHQDVESQVLGVQKQLLKMLNQEKDTALHIAVRKGHLAIAKLLMEADPELLEFVNSTNASPLFLAVEVEKGYRDLIICILETSLACHFGGPRGMTALHSAVIRDLPDIVEVLLQKRSSAMIKEVDMHGRTPLHYAACRGYLETTRLLLQYHSSTTYLLDKDGTSALHFAALKGHIHIVKELVQYCPDIAELIDKKGRTALHVAIIYGQEKMVRYILKMPKLASMVNEMDEEGNTALHLAVIYNKVNIIKYLALDRRVEKTAMNMGCSTAFDIFISQRNEPSYSAAKTYYFLRGPKGLPYMQQYFESCEKRKMLGEDREQEKSDLGAAEQNSDEITRSMVEIHLLVAMLIATVTFQAAFTMPGGYEDNGHDKGMATFIGKAMFKAFVIFNTTAFYFSIASVITYLATSKLSFRSRTRFTRLAKAFIFIALYAMVLGFASGVFLVVAKSIGLAITLCIMVAIFLLSYITFRTFDPMASRPYRSAGYFKFTDNIRNVLFRYGIF